MRQLLLIMAVVMGSLTSYAQPVTANEMLDMIQCTGVSCLEAQLLPKGYEAGTSNKTEDYSVYEYYSKTSEPYDDNELVILPHQLQYSITGDAYIIAVNFVTGSKVNYEAILNDFKKEGFVVVPDDKNTGDERSHIYMNPDMPGVKLSVTVYHKLKNEQKYTEYGFKLNRMTDPPQNELEAHKAMFPLGE